jgi:hypothetical protein
MPFILAAGLYCVRKPLQKTTCGFCPHLITFRTMNTHQLHRLGYARVSSIGQNLDSQIDALKAAGYKKIFHRQDDWLPHGSPRLGSAHGVRPPGRLSGRGRVEPHDALPDASARNGASARPEAGQPRLPTRKHRYQHRHRTVLPFNDGRNPSDGTGTAGRTSSRRTGLREGRGKTGGRPRTDVVKLRDAKVLYDNSGKTAAEVCKVVGVGRRIFFAYLAHQRDQTSAALTAN